ncbi:MAG: SPOR domain-containing protein [Alphaproteobacteria bacterium]|nr:SPOR domain-containing protein [Alphaproteobacteria bacterium]
MAFQDGRGGSRVEPRFETLDKPGAGFTPRADEPASNLRGKMAGALVALAAVAGFGGIAWYATTQGQKDSSTVVPLIRADNTPIKVLPAQPGGMKVPNQDKLIFMRINPGQKKPKVERLLPPPEKPMARTAPPPKPKPAQAAAKAPPKIPPGDARPKPKPVKPAAKPVKTIPPVKTISPVKAIPKVKQAVKMARASKAPAAPAQEAFRVQLGAVKSKTGAEGEVRRLTRLHKSVLAGLTVKVVRADLGKRGIFYRLRAGPLADRTAANLLCAKLKARKQGCIVIEP